MRAVVAMMAAVALSAPAAAADQFDLSCHARKRAVHYRVDLAASEFCADACTQIRSIKGVTQGLITIRDLRPQRRGQEEARETINRVTGEWYQYSFDPELDTVPTIVEGRCDALPFSGFPAAKF